MSKNRKEYLKEYQREWLKRRRQQWLEENGPCVRCGSTENLEVDHINPNERISHRVWSWSAKRRSEELAKCQVLCHICHVDKTYIDCNYKLVHGFGGYWSKGCRCFFCRHYSMIAQRIYRGMFVPMQINTSG